MCAVRIPPYLLCTYNLLFRNCKFLACHESSAFCKKSFPEISNSYVPEGPALVEFYASRNWVHKLSPIQAHAYTWQSSWNHLQHTETRSATTWRLRRLRCRPAVFSSNVRLISLSFVKKQTKQNKNKKKTKKTKKPAFKKCYHFSLFTL